MVYSNSVVSAEFVERAALVEYFCILAAFGIFDIGYILRMVRSEGYNGDR
jgi:hypothetical protein